MGVVESKALADALLSACRNAEIQGKDRLDDELLRKDEVSHFPVGGDISNGNSNS
jgi:hypothetical protein